MRKPIIRYDCTEIGFVKKTHGTKGELQIFFQEGVEEILEGLEYLFFEFEGHLVPFFIDSILSIGTNSAIILFDTLTAKEKANNFVGCKLFIGNEWINGITIPFSVKQIIGFTLYGTDKCEIGKITNIDDYGGNLVLSVDHKGKEILIPFNEKLLHKFNSKDQILIMECNQGLYDLND